MQKGEIYLANLNPVIGSEQAGMRPVVIVQIGKLSDEWMEKIQDTLAFVLDM